MAQLDPSRTALQADEHELGVASLLLVSPDDPELATDDARRTIAALERAGIVENGRLVGYPARIVSVLLNPEIRVLVERFAAKQTVRDFAAVAGGSGVWGERLQDGGQEMTPIEPELIPWQVARSVGLGPRADHTVDAPITVSVEAFQQALDRFADGDQAGALELLELSALEPTQAAALTQLIYDRRLSWRAFSILYGEGEPSVISGVAVIDGGDSGLWFSEHEDGENGAATIRLTPARPSEVWDRILALIPQPVATESG